MVKSILRLIHLWLGIVSGTVIFIVAITGCIYCFEKEIRSAVYHELYFVEKTGPKKLNISHHINTAERLFPKEKIKNVIVPGGAEETVQVNFKNKITVFLDPYTGNVNGIINMNKEFFSVVLDLHRSLCLGETGKVVTGTSALIFLIMIISGIILWWPVTRRFLAQKFRFRTRIPLQGRLYDLHSVAGFYGSFILLFTSLSGIIFAFKWAEHTMFFLSGSPKPAKTEINSGKPKEIKESPLDIAFGNAKGMSGDVQQVVIIMPEKDNSSVRMAVQYHDIAFYKRSDQLYFDRYSGALLKEKLFKDAPAGEKLRATNYNIHTGKVLGLAGQIIVFMAGLIAASLPVTGFWMYLNKRRLNRSVKATLPGRS